MEYKPNVHLGPPGVRGNQFSEKILIAPSKYNNCNNFLKR